MLETLQLSWRVTQRHWEIYCKNFVANILPTITDPGFFILSIGVGLGSYVSDLDGRSYVQYLAPGLTISTALFTAFFETSYNFYVRLSFEGIYKALLTTPLNTREILIGEMIWIGLKGAGMATVVASVMCLLQIVDFRMLWIIPFVGAATALACGGLGLIGTSLVKNINQFQTIYTLLINPIFFFSGIFFPVSDLPTSLQYVAYLSPLYHGVQITQAALWNEGLGETLFHHGPILIGMSTLLCLVAYKMIYPKLYI